MQTDEALTLSIQEGDEEAMDVLVKRHYNKLLGYMIRLNGGRRILAEDMVQETFLRMMRGITLYQTSRPFKPWLYAIATNIARNYYTRADTRYTENPREDAVFEDESAQTEEAVMQSEEAQSVIRALAQLPDHQREVVVLFYYQELPQKEIADALSIPVGTVKSRLSLGLRRLRSIIEAQESTQ